jgi:hypothetical protein
MDIQQSVDYYGDQFDMDNDDGINSIHKHVKDPYAIDEDENEDQNSIHFDTHLYACK